jgi:hypothetical protein
MLSNHDLTHTYKPLTAATTFDITNLLGAITRISKTIKIVSLVSDLKLRHTKAPLLATFLTIMLLYFALNLFSILVNLQLQPPPETVANFDELILISEGMVIYSGPMEDVIDHFNILGYDIPERMDLADWLQVYDCPRID